MKLLLTSSGITLAVVKQALVDLIGKPIAESKALIVLAGIYPFRDGPYHAWAPLAGEKAPGFAQLGWQAVGLLEITALPSISRETWLPTLAEADALLVWGGDPLFLAYWMAESGSTDLLPSLAKPPVYVGISAGAIATASVFGEIYSDLPRTAGKPLATEHMRLPDGNLERMFVTANGMGLTDFAIIPHFENPDHGDMSIANAAAWAAKLPVPVYAIDEQTAIKFDGTQVDIVSEGRWTLFTRTVTAEE